MMDLTRRTYLAGLATLALMPPRPSAAESYCNDKSGAAYAAPKPVLPLGDISPRTLWGVALASPALYDESLVQAISAERPKFLAIANALKFGNLYPEPADIDASEGKSWRECDDIVALAKRLRVPLRGDCLAWNEWLPKWLVDLAQRRDERSKDTVMQIYQRHFQNVFAHFRRLETSNDMTLLRWCGVINEPFNPWIEENGAPAWRKGAWLNAFGLASDGIPLYIHQAFVFGERFGSNAISLFLNETYCDNDRFGPKVRLALLRLVDALQRAGRKVDAIGLECHLMPQWMNEPDKPDWKPFVGFIRELARRNVEIYITELDVNDCSLNSVAERDAQVAAYMDSFVTAALQVPAVTMVTNWDLSDKYSWLRGDASPSDVFPSLGGWANCVSHPSCPRPDPYDQNMHPKAARDALARALGVR
ncbi:endo-1,4-beta-xylanase [Methyloferula stellata]|uniref:endo-1,4-beta-xylanase n=1 Tax=Methyloferula stellata TaxID=876270 RepID=UPI00039F13A3|nr:endo-1,4-beta-xylanase [Methyloferula stellata]